MNSIILIGNICNDLELKSTNSGKSVCSFNLAVKRPFAKDVTDFITIVCWNKQAENVFKFCGKGTRIGVSGMMTTRNWEDNEGNKRTAYEVVANEIEFLQKKADGQSNVASTNYVPTMDTDADGFVMVDEEDLPF
jgi:single-strand DNA-binding protein